MGVGAVVWHDVECGGYGADLPLWRELAARADGPVLDVGAGTGRVALDLARRGHEVTALDADAALVVELRHRAGGLPVEAVHGDARDFDLAREFALVLVPMQTLQLLGGTAGRTAFLRCAARHLAPGALLAAALADALDGFDADHPEPPLPDIREHADGTVYASRVVAVRPQSDGVRIERIRETVDPAGHREASADALLLERADVTCVQAEGAAIGLVARPSLRVPATDEHVGSEVVVLHRPAPS